MNRTILTAIGMFSASSLLLADSAVKGTALLILTAGVVLLLRRDSAATRHLVWLLAIVALLAVPVMSAVLPQWRVLPEWARVASNSVKVVPSPTSTNRVAPTQAVEWPQNVDVTDFEQPQSTVDHPEQALSDARPALATSKAMPSSPESGWTWGSLLPIAWGLGFVLLILRLIAARLILWKTERDSTVIGSSQRLEKASDVRLVVALESARLQLGVRGAVTLLIHHDKTIPMVWGILRQRLLLPVAVREWSDEQLRSVLLHELAHIKRRDTTAQLLAQIACALHWFNPLVWFADWRLSVERERACDDLVLTCGIRPSTYAGHLLDVVTDLSLAQGTHSCGLAMARKSSLEDRLIAVLSNNLNRRGISAALAAIAIAVGIGIVIPVSMLRAVDEQPAGIANAVADDIEREAPQGGAALDSRIEQRMQWGEPVNGLRMALIRPPALGAPDPGEVMDFNLVVQNVSNAPVQFNTNSAGPNTPGLKIRQNGTTLAIINSAKPDSADVLLRPRDIAVMRVFPGFDKGRTVTDDPQLVFSVELKIENAPKGAWTGKLVTAETASAYAAYGLLPKQKDARTLFIIWNASTRMDGKIPGALIGQLAESVKLFTKNNPTWETTPQLLKMLLRLDATRDWTGPDALTLLEELAELQSTPISMVLENESHRIIRTGKPLPEDLENAPWGTALPNRIRTAWLLEPNTAEHRIGTPLKARILFQNIGKTSLVFRTRTWHQATHTARDANGNEINVSSTHWLTRGQLVPFRLAPGEYAEVSGPGIGIGKNENDEDWQHTRVGTWINAREGDVVSVTTSPVSLSDWNEEPPTDGEPRWWLAFIKARLARDLPLPENAEERKRLAYRVAMDLFGTPFSAEEVAAFISDNEPNAIDSFAERLARGTRLRPFVGSLTSGTTTFRVLPTDPDAATKPRTAKDPGRYTLRENATLVVSRRPVGDHIVNEAHIAFSPSDATASAPREPHKIKLPYGYDTWAAAWVRGESLLWVQQKGFVRRYDFTNPVDVKETNFEDSAELDRVPQRILDTLRTTLNKTETAKPQEAPKKDAPAAAVPVPQANQPDQKKSDDIKVVGVDQLLQHDAPLETLIEAIKSNDFSTRIRALQFIGDRGAAAEEAVPALIATLENRELRESVLHALKNIGPHASQAIPALFRLLTAYPLEPATRWIAASALASIGEPAIPTLKKGLESKNIFERVWSHAALAKLEGPDSIHLQVLAEFMASKDPTTSREAISGLDMIGSDVKPVIPQIIAALDLPTTPKPDLAVLLSKVGAGAKPAIPRLVALLDHADAMTRQRSAYALAAIGGTDLLPAVPGLIRMLSAEQDYVRDMAATTLGKTGPVAVASLGSLIERLREDQNEHVRAASAQALGNISPADATVQSALIKAMNDNSGRVRSQVAPILAQHGTVTKELIQVFINASDDKFQNVSNASRTFFSRLGAEEREVIQNPRE